MRAFCVMCRIYKITRADIVFISSNSNIFYINVSQLNVTQNQNVFIEAANVMSIKF